MTVDDPWASDWTPPPATPEPPLSAYDQALAAAGFGPADRARFIAEHGTSTEYAACVWDEELVPAAEAAGTIPQRTVPEEDMEETVRHWCGRAAIRQLDADRHARGERVGLAVNATEVDEIRARTERLVHWHAAALSDLLRTTPRPRWVKDNPAAQAAAAEYDRRVFALLTREPRVVVLCGSTRFMAEMAEANWQETAAGRIVLAPGCDLKMPHPLLNSPAAVEELKPLLDELHRAKIRMADEVLVVGDYIGSSTRAEIAYSHELGKAVRYTHPEIEENTK